MGNLFFQDEEILFAQQLEKCKNLVINEQNDKRLICDYVKEFERKDIIQSDITIMEGFMSQIMSMYLSKRRDEKNINDVSKLFIFKYNDQYISDINIIDDKGYYDKYNVIVQQIRDEVKRWEDYKSIRDKKSKTRILLLLLQVYELIYLK